MRKVRYYWRTRYVPMPEWAEVIRSIIVAAVVLTLAVIVVIALFTSP